MADALEEPIVQTALLDILNELGFGGAVLAVESYTSKLCSSFDAHSTHARSPELVS